MSILKRRQLEVTGMIDDAAERRLEAAIMELQGVSGADADRSAGRLLVEYDLLRVNLRGLEHAIEQLGYDLEPGFIATLRRNLIHTTEENEKSNYLSSGLCCSECVTPPRGRQLPDEVIGELRPGNSHSKLGRN